VVQSIDVTGRGIEDIHDELHHVAFDIVQNVGDKELGHLWTDDANDLTTVSGS